MSIVIGLGTKKKAYDLSVPGAGSWGHPLNPSLESGVSEWVTGAQVLPVTMNQCGWGRQGIMAAESFVNWEPPYVCHRDMEMPPYFVIR